MPYKQNLNKATELKVQLDSFRPLTPEMETRIMQKFRLDWNYHSSHIEGNQLTYGETKALLLFGHTAQAKPLKDHLEMTGHNDAIKNIEDIIKQKRPLTEQFIRELHELILKEPYEVNAITPDGHPTKRTIQIGEYKLVPNHVKTKTGELFYFATPEETPAKMNELMDWYKENLKNNEVHPILFATEFHYRFIRIHPFDDGNGRISRLLMNFILMLKGYPPAIIKTEEKNNYFAALQQADAGQLEFFFNYICEQEIKSLQLMIKGANGEEIDEPDDIDKELALLKRELAREDILKTPASAEIIADTIENSIIPLFEEIEKKFMELNEFFFDKRRIFQYKLFDSDSVLQVGTSESSWETIKNNWLPRVIREQNLKVGELTYYFELKGFKKTAEGQQCYTRIEVFFRDYNFIIQTEYNQGDGNRIPYGHQITQEENRDIVRPIFKSIIERIKSWK